MVEVCLMNDGGGDRGQIALQISSLKMLVTEETVICVSLLSTTNMARSRRCCRETGVPRVVEFTCPLDMMLPP